MKKHTSHLTSPLFTKTLLSALIAVTAAGAQAQSTSASNAVEEVIVTGQFQRNLQNALDIKRNATTIVDGISADDIGSLPALDMGEALQAVAGVQLNREGERRESSVNLRGLPAGFVLTTVNGQQMATPTRVNNLESSPFGAASPLGAFDPAVFSGIQVIKTTTASMIEGGISGTINQAVGGALKKRDGKYVVSIANRYEDLEESNDPEIVLSASKHLIADTLAVTATFATSDQTFRRDTIKINQYNDLTTGNFRGADGESLAEWKTANGLNADDTVQIPGELRQGSEISEGTRTSFSGGLEWQANDELKLGYNLMYTNRDMDQNTQQELDLRPRTNGTKITPLSAPFATGKDATSGGKLYSVSDIAFENVQYGATSRIYDLAEESVAHIFDAVWELDRWTLDAKATLSAS
jgi:iron complex outermembrane recepter protein